MAVLGFSKLFAVNHMLRAVNELPFTALDSTGSYPSATYGSSIAARAEELLDIETDSHLMRGLDENVVWCEAHTASGSPLGVTFNSDTLYIRSAGPNQHRNFTLRGDALWDLDNNTATLAAGTYYVDRVYRISFVNLSPRSKDDIMRAATVIFQRRYRGSPDQDAQLQEERFMSAAAAIRPLERRKPSLINPVPVLPPQQYRQQQDQQQ